MRRPLDGGARPALAKASRRVSGSGADLNVTLDNPGQLQAQLRDGRLTTRWGSEARVVLAAGAAVRKRKQRSAATADMAPALLGSTVDSTGDLPVETPALGSVSGHLQGDSQEASLSEPEHIGGGSTQCSLLDMPDADESREAAFVTARQEAASEESRETANLDVQQDVPLSSDSDQTRDTLSSGQHRSDSAQTASESQESTDTQTTETKEQVDNQAAEVPWRTTGEQLELSAPLLAEWSQRLHGRPTFEHDGIQANRRCYLGAGSDSPAALERQLIAFGAVAKRERRVGSGSTSAFCVLPVTNRMTDSLWGQMTGWKVVTVYTVDDVWTSSPDSTRPEGGGGVAIAMYWVSANELKATNRRGERCAWWTDAPELIGDRGFDTSRLSQAKLERPLASVVDQTDAQVMLMVDYAITMAKRSERHREAPCGSAHTTDSLFAIEEDIRVWSSDRTPATNTESVSAASADPPVLMEMQTSRRPQLMTFDAVRINNKLGKVLLDTGASYEYGGLDAAQRSGCTLDLLDPADRVKVKLADGRVVECCYSTMVDLEFAAFKTSVRLLLLPTLPGYDVVIGNRWLEEQERTLGGGSAWSFSFVHRSVTLRSPAGKPIITLDGNDRRASTLLDRPSFDGPGVASHREISAAQQEGDELHLLWVAPDGSVLSAEPIVEQLDRLEVTHDDLLNMVSPESSGIFTRRQ